MGAADALIIVGGIAVLGYFAYAHMTGNLEKWLAGLPGASAAPSVGADSCNKISTGPSGFRYQCGCAGSAPFVMGPQYSKLASTEACSACKVECNKRRATAAGAGMGFAESFATYPMRGLIVS